MIDAPGEPELDVVDAPVRVEPSAFGARSGERSEHVFARGDEDHSRPGHQPTYRESVRRTEPT